VKNEIGSLAITVAEKILRSKLATTEDQSSYINMLSEEIKRTKNAKSTSRNTLRKIDLRPGCRKEQPPTFHLLNMQLLSNICTASRDFENMLRSPIIKADKKTTNCSLPF